MPNVKIKRYKKVLVANRGEIAIRVYRALNELGIQTVGIFSKEDKYALFRTKTDEAYMLNPEKGPLDAYLDIKNIIKIYRYNHFAVFSLLFLITSSTVAIHRSTEYARGKFIFCTA